MATDESKVEAQKYLVALLQQMTALAQTNAQLVQQNNQLMQQQVQVTAQLALCAEAINDAAATFEAAVVELRQSASPVQPSEQLVEGVLAALKQRLAPPFPPPAMRPAPFPRPPVRTAFPRS